MNTNKYWILRIIDSESINQDYPHNFTSYNNFEKSKRNEYIKIPINISYNQIFKLLFLIKHIHDNEFENGDLFIEELTSIQVVHLMKRIFGYEIITNRNISKDNNNVKNIALFHFTDEKMSIKNKYVDYFDNGIEKFLNECKYFYDRWGIDRIYIRDDKENEPLLFKDINRIRKELKKIIDEGIDSYENRTFNNILKKDIVSIYHHRIKDKEKHVYIVLDKDEQRYITEKIIYISILNDNFYRRKATQEGLAEYPSYSPVNGNINLTPEEMSYFLSKIYGYKILNKEEIQILNKKADKNYNNGKHEHVLEHCVLNAKGSYDYLENKDQKNYARPNVSKIILERQIEKAPENKKEYYIKKLNKLKKIDGPEYLKLSALKDYY
ncbi:hypothetical protein ACTOJ1_000460 [Shigella flexneri]